MPIFFNFHILLATFYTIFGTNILISTQCQFLFVACFRFRRNPISNRVQTGENRTENYFGIFVIFGRKNQRQTVSEVATRQGGAPWTLVGHP